MDSSFNVFSLNCWGVRVPLVGSKLITQRFAAIADLVIKNDYDVVVFQEVWSMHDYVALSCKILDKFPHTHYFHGGFLGSGLCIFSKHPIIETVYHEFPLNGHAYKLLHGDWYGAKGCGLAILKVKDLTVNMYATHMHARYNHTSEFDEYCGLRAMQGFSLSQFIKHTSKVCDAVIAVGDFNSTTNEAAYRVVRSNAMLNDAWLVKNAEGSHGGGETCDCPANCFIPQSVTNQLATGQRIDYIFYRANEQTDIVLDSCRVLTDKIPGTDIDYSDHYGLEAHMVVKRSITAGQVPELDVGVRQTSLKEVAAAVDKGAARARYNKYFYFVTMLLSLMVLLLCRERYTGEAGLFLHSVLEVVQGMMGVMAFLSFWIWCVLCKLEENGYTAIKTDIAHMLQPSLLTRPKKD